MANLILSIEQANELLSQLGTDLAVAAEVESPEDVNYEEIVSEIQPPTGPPTEPSAEVIDTAVNKAVGKIMGTIRSSIGSKFSLKRSDYEGLDIDEMMDKLKSQTSSRYTQTESGLRTELDEANQRYNDLEEKLIADWQKKLDEKDALFEERDIRDRYRSLLGNIPRSGGDLDKQADLMLREAKGRFVPKYNPVTGQVEFFDKLNPEQRIMEGKNPMTDEIFANSFVDNLGIRVTDTRHISPSSLNGGEPGGQQRIPDEPKTAMQKFAEKIDAQLEE